MPVGVPFDLPESFSYRLKNRVLGKPLHTEELEHERLGKPTALAIFASDCISSSAYATEEILRNSVYVVGLAAFSLVVPITISLLVVLLFLVLSYRETIKEYPTAGGAYMVTRDNFGLLPAQVAGVALLTDYILTVAVSVAAGTAALTSAFEGLSSYKVEISIFFIVIIAFGNLRGVRESGAIFRLPTYFFIVVCGSMILWGFYQMAAGHLPVLPANYDKGLLDYGNAGTGFAYGIGLWKLLTAFASGGAAVTGVEAISNGVPAFRKPEWLNARQTLFYMAGTLGALFLGLSILAAHMHIGVYAEGTPTVISQIGDYVFGQGSIGRVFYFALQGGTMLILVLAANTSFADFPRLASFHAGDNFMPKQLTKRGHRLVFSNGIIALAVAAVFLVIVTGAKVDRLIPLYAIGVFTSFTLSQAGMAKHHWTKRQPGWKHGIWVNGIGAFLSFVVLVIVSVTKFTHGAWAIMILVPIMVSLLVRLNRQYESEAVQLESEIDQALATKVMRRHIVLVFIDDLNTTTARALQYGRALAPDELRAVHIAVDEPRAKHLANQWQKLPSNRFPLEIVECPDRRIARSALELVARELSGGNTEVTVLLPKRVYKRRWHSLLHDRTADEIARTVGRLPHANVTSVPFTFETTSKEALAARHAAAAHSHH
jgi:amino acid transporter